MAEGQADELVGTDREVRNHRGEAFVRVPDGARPELPEAASKRMSWEGSGPTVGERIDYRATAGHVDVRADDGGLLARMFALSYVALGEDGNPVPGRPVTFAWNGGPGSASVPINLGGIGPRRVQTDGVRHLRADAPVVDNPHTLLRETDLVFLDAPGTGLSALADGADKAKLLGVEGDADAFCRAITAWLEDNGRWASPVYLFGESYGTVRNAVLMRLMGERGVKLTGVVMLSAIWNWVQTLPGEDLYYLGMVPTFAATAHFFGKAGQGASVEEWFARAMAWVDETYAPALLAGDRLGQARERQVAQEMSQLVGIPEALILRRHLRVSLEDVRANLLADEGRVTGRLDMRFSSDAPGYQQQSWGWFAGEDAADDAVNAVWDMAFRAHLAELGYHAPARYIDSNWESVGTAWSWTHTEPGCEETVGAPNVTIDLACALRRDPTIKLAVIGGRYDAATTWWNVPFELSRQFLSDEVKSRVDLLLYNCGHMAYVDEPTLAAMAGDLHTFYQKR